jgi:monofunctional biosynthetic peptidoglycan transglycosylase
MTPDEQGPDQDQPRAPEVVPPRVHIAQPGAAAADNLDDEPLADFTRAAPHGPSMQADPEIPMPARPRRGDGQRRRDAKRNLDLDLGRIKRRKRYGLFITSISVLFVAFVLAPVTWVFAYLFFDPPSTVLMMQRAAEGQTIRHYPVPLNRVSPHVVRAIIAAEDANFCSHSGFDVEAIQDAMESNARGRRTRGASTVSQQTAKNLFLWPERSWLRKGLETYFTSLIEFVWPKRRIMEAYLNAAEWGDGNFGIEAAARARFGVSAADLTPLQAARLAAVLPSPNRWSADNPGPYVRRRSATIVQRARVVRNEGLAACVLALDRPGNAS